MLEHGTVDGHRQPANRSARAAPLAAEARRPSRGSCHCRRLRSGLGPCPEFGTGDTDAYPSRGGAAGSAAEPETGDGRHRQPAIRCRPPDQPQSGLRNPAALNRAPFAMSIRPSRPLGNKLLSTSAREPMPQLQAAIRLMFSTKNRIPCCHREHRLHRCGEAAEKEQECADGPSILHSSLPDAGPTPPQTTPLGCR